MNVVLFVLGVALATLATLHIVPFMLIMVGVPLMFAILRSIPSNPRPVRRPSRPDRTAINGPEWWDNRAKRWVPWDDPYSEPVAFEQAFGTDPLDTYRMRILSLREEHARGELTSEQLADCIENIEVVASARPREDDDPFKRIRKQYAARQGRRPPSKPKRKQTLEDVYASLVKLEGNAKAAERAVQDMKAMYPGTDSPGKIAVLPRGTSVVPTRRLGCDGCQTVYTVGSGTPIGRYCDGSCNS